MDKDMLSIMLLYSLPSRYENFRCAIESRDELLDVNTLKIKIVEESDARKKDASESSSEALFVGKHNFSRNQPRNRKESNKNDASLSKKNLSFPYKCHRCREIGHRASDCPRKDKNLQSCKNVVSLYVVDAQQAMIADGARRCVSTAVPPLTSIGILIISPKPGKRKSER